MKKIILSTVILASSIALVGCSSSNKDSKSSSKSQIVSVPKKNNYYFKNNVAKLHDEKIEITKTKVINPGEEGNQYGDKPIIAFWYKTTNYTDKKIDPISAWESVFEAYQDNNKNQENKLNVGMLPDEKYLDSQTQAIKKNGTVENAISYELSDTTTPVQLKASKGIDGKALGDQTYKLK
ncbi:DUF5067 domain-containing protein (plasmid) [Fructilactobacillus ixorae]|uniref:DUF5067 domain-containing protein n=1 Tax=Fructilactobacillus ixorae TaxID=1750535 RepID=A0ABY5C7F2_9LACO|nr:DUF5067 domain-containing protein [Fructilactobacillus ixorae]USS93959.1 DUF5067 domain-containing protein [Fructilactobacillus ixorae]